MFAERPAGQPQAAKEWYYPQRSTGEEFIYPKAQALALAQANRTAVASEENGKVVRVEGNESTNAAAAPAASPTPQRQVAENATPAPAAAPAPARQPAPAAVGTAGQNTAASPAPRPAPAPARTLPRTASQLGLFGLLSILSICAAFSVRQLRLRAAARR
jgi:hypothetical protein